MKKKICVWLLLCGLFHVMNAQKVITVTSPNGKLTATVTVDKLLTYSLSFENQQLMTPSVISMTFDEGLTFGVNSKLGKVLKSERQNSIPGVFYKKSNVEDSYREQILCFRNFNLEMRAYNEGFAYRFVSTVNKPLTVMGEQEELNFSKDFRVRAAYTNAGNTIDEQFGSSFENCYTRTTLSQLRKDNLSFLPLLVEADNGVKMCITEADLENYPGMYLRNMDGKQTLTGVFAPYPFSVKHGGLMGENEQGVCSREDYLVKATAKQKFPWRIVAVSAHDEELLNNDLVYCLASPSRIDDVSWIKPGKVAWEWWNSRGLYGVPFKAGNNQKTYQYYIDFAAKNGVEYIILDGGWSREDDLFQVASGINLPELVAYGKQKNVGIILWAGFYVFDRQMEEACRRYSEMGIKGFKVDFIDRDDAQAVNFHYRSAAVAAKYHLLIDFHGTYKPTGLSRTYPNVLNYEGVNGQEQNRWSTIERYDQVPYDTELPFIRMMAGQMDYTQGAMINATRQEFHQSEVSPMSQGTRCHQLAEYVIFFSPLNMLCDSPTHYEKEPECTAFICGIPTIWDETVALKSELGEYVVMARRKGHTWYLGALNNWTARDLTLQLDFLGVGNYQAEAFSDGMNADRYAQDYWRETKTIPQDRKMQIHLAPGGGFAMKMEQR